MDKPKNHVRSVVVSGIAMRRPHTLPGVVLGLALPFSEAGAVDIALHYHPGNSGDGFENATPASGYCVEFGGCAPGETSLQLPVRYARQVISGLPPLSSRWSVQVPPQAQVILVSDQGIGLTLGVQITHIAQLLSGTGFSRYENPGFHWSTGGGCHFENSQAFDGGATMGFVWEVANPLAPGLCYPTSGGVSEGARDIEPQVTSFSIGYRLLLPAAHTIPMGRYTGSLTWSVGESGDFALGSLVTGLSANSVTFNFLVDVDHELSVDFDNNASRVQLQPMEGSWAQWMMFGAPANARLGGRLPLRLTATGPFTVYLTCEHPGPMADCATANTRNGELAAVTTLLTLPRGVVYQGAPVQRLRLAEHVRYPLEVSRAVTAEPGVVEFDTVKGEVHQMIKHGGDTYSGQVTLNFDAQLL